MRTRLARTIALVSCAAWSVGGSIGCASNGLDPGAGDAAGTGTGTLSIEGEVYASPRQSGAQAAGDFDVDFAVRVLLNNQTVTTGTVTVTSSSGKVPLTFHADPSGVGWSASVDTYDEVYVLDVVSGDDKAEGIRIDGPDIQTFTQPQEGATVDASMPLAIKWLRNRAASQTTLRADANPPLEIDDTGSFTLPPGSLRADRQQARRHTLRLVRTNSVTPAGAVDGSTWSATVENDVDVITPPLPF